VGDYVFGNEPSWCAFWSDAFIDVSPPPACPAVDFCHELVIASLTQEGGCSRSQIDSIMLIGRRHSVEAHLRHSFPAPDAGCICLASSWQVMQALAITRPIGTVEFVHESVEFDCH